MWTGDNLGTWEHMDVGLKMVLANSLGGFSFAGGVSSRTISLTYLLMYIHIRS